MNNLSIIQKEFFMALSEIQDSTVNVALCKHRKDESLEDILYDVTYEAIYGVMELLDGYVKKTLSFEIIEKQSQQSLRENLELHDTCEEFLKY